ncbi:MAG: ATP-grasp domain-containing protein [Desulfobacteraceae bacterium]|nr:ATP-grasp domain-containing protein [Desulfobacteraceae bacterium]
MERKQRILFLCDASDVEEVEHSFAQQSTYEVTIETTEKILSFGVREYLYQTVERINHHPEIYKGVVGTHDSSAIFAAIIAEETGKKFASVQSVICCQNKYLCRRIQRACIPEYTPNFCLALDYLRNPDRLQTPFFIKPVRANISFGAHRIETPQQLEFYIGSESMDIARFNQYYLEAIGSYSKHYNAINMATCNSFLCEDLIDGNQVTVDGYIFEGDVTCFGITKAVYHPRTNSFSHHEFPYELSAGLDSAITSALSRLIPETGLNNSFFNVEIRIDEAAETFKIIEVNSRIAFQFARTIEAVTGISPLYMLCDVAAGKRPTLTPQAEQLYKYCYNFELHRFSDAKILQTPTKSVFDEIGLKYPEIRIRNLIHENVNLSDFKHNPESFRYCILDVPGNSREEILSKYDDVVAMLSYKFDTPDEHSRINEPAGQPPEQLIGRGHEIEFQPEVKTGANK